MELFTSLEWLAKYGFIDIFFGLGVLGFVYKLFQRAIPRNLDELSVSVDFESRNNHLLYIQISNSGGKNIYISRAYFKPRRNKWYELKKRPSLKFLTQPNYYNLTHKHYEVRFSADLKSYDVLIKPGFENKQSTALGLQEIPEYRVLGEGLYGKLTIEYSTYGKQGKHVICV